MSTRISTVGDVVHDLARDFIFDGRSASGAFRFKRGEFAVLVQPGGLCQVFQFVGGDRVLHHKNVPMQPMALRRLVGEAGQ